MAVGSGEEPGQAEAVTQPGRHQPALLTESCLSPLPCRKGTCLSQQVVQGGWGGGQRVTAKCCDWLCWLSPVC